MQYTQIAIVDVLRTLAWKPRTQCVQYTYKRMLAHVNCMWLCVLHCIALHMYQIFCHTIWICCLRVPAIIYLSKCRFNSHIFTFVGIFFFFFIRTSLTRNCVTEIRKRYTHRSDGCERFAVGDWKQSHWISVGWSIRMCHNGMCLCTNMAKAAACKKCTLNEQNPSYVSFLSLF